MYSAVARVINSRSIIDHGGVLMSTMLAVARIHDLTSLQRRGGARLFLTDQTYTPLASRATRNARHLCESRKKRELHPTQAATPL